MKKRIAFVLMICLVFVSTGCGRNLGYSVGYSVGYFIGYLESFSNEYLDDGLDSGGRYDDGDDDSFENEYVDCTPYGEITVNNEEEFLNAINKIATERYTSATIHYNNSDYLDVFNGISDEQFYNIFDETLFWMDDPSTSDDCDYLWGNVSYYSLNLIEDNSDNAIYTLEFIYFETQSEKEQVNQWVSNKLAELNLNGLSQYEKIKVIHDCVVEQISFDNKTDCCYSAYGGAIDKLTVCNGYALLFYKLCTEAQIPCKFVSGMAGEPGDKGLHAWNMVEIDEKWYFVDTTWDDDGEVSYPGDIFYDYFLRGLDYMSYDHELEEPYCLDEFTSIYSISNDDYPINEDLNMFY